MQIKNYINDLLSFYAEYKDIVPVGSWDYLLTANGYLETNDNDNWQEDAEKSGYHINPGISDKFSQLYLVLEDGPAPLTLTLEEYFKAMFEFRGIVFPWPIMFVKEDNLDHLVLSQKHESIKKAKENAKKLGLSPDFKRFGLGS